MTTPGDLVPDDHPARWRLLALLAVSELLGMSLWFTGSAIAPQLQERWHLSAAAVGWLTTTVQLGFVAGTALSALLNMADVVPARLLFTTSALAGALVNALFAFSPSYRLALWLRAATGFCLAGVYPPAMKMAATWFRARRGLAVGTIVGALTVARRPHICCTRYPGSRDRPWCWPPVRGRSWPQP